MKSGLSWLAFVRFYICYNLSSLLDLLFSKSEFLDLNYSSFLISLWFMSLIILIDSLSASWPTGSINFLNMLSNKISSSDKGPLFSFDSFSLLISYYSKLTDIFSKSRRDSWSLIAICDYFGYWFEGVKISMISSSLSSLTLRYSTF